MEELCASLPCFDLGQWKTRRLCCLPVPVPRQEARLEGSSGLAGCMGGGPGTNGQGVGLASSSQCSFVPTGVAVECV